MDEQRAEFEAWASHFFTRGELDRHGINGARPGEYRVLHIERMWGAWQAATQRQQERIAALEAQVQALSVDAGRWRFAASHNAEGRLNFGVVYDAWDGDGSFTDQIDAAIAAGKGEV